MQELRASAEIEIFRSSEEGESVIGAIFARQRKELEEEIGVSAMGPIPTNKHWVSLATYRQWVHGWWMKGHDAAEWRSRVARSVAMNIERPTLNVEGKRV